MSRELISAGGGTSAVIVMRNLTRFIDRKQPIRLAPDIRLAIKRIENRKKAIKRRQKDGFKGC